MFPLSGNVKEDFALGKININFAFCILHFTLKKPLEEKPCSTKEQVSL